MTNPRESQRVAQKQGMPARTKSITFVIPVAHLDAINADLERQGLGPNNFGVDLEGGMILKRVTHVACSVCADASTRRVFENIIQKHVGRRATAYDSIESVEKTMGVKRRQVKE